MVTTAERLQELAQREPLLQQAEAAARVGVTRERVRQLTNNLNLPFAKSNKQLRILRLYHAGLHQIDIAAIAGVSSSWVVRILHENDLPLRTLPKPCGWCGTTYESRATDARWCSPRCSNSHRQHVYEIQRRGNGTCLSCGVERAISFRHSCSSNRRKHRFTQPNRDGKEAT